MKHTVTSIEFDKNHTIIVLAIKCHKSEYFKWYRRLERFLKKWGERND